MRLDKEEMKALRRRLKESLSEKRYRHSIGVAETARDLALHYGCDPEQAYLAGLVHDYAKSMKKSELVEIAERENLLRDPIEKELTEVLHGPVGAWRLPRETTVNDPEILEAVANHTLGAVRMTLLDKIIFVADIVEPNRSTPDLEKEREIAFQDLDRAILRSLDSTIRYCLEIGRLLHPDSVFLRNEYIRLLREKEK